MKSILILMDDYRRFSNSRVKPGGIDANILVDLFSKKGYHAQSMTLMEIDWDEDFSNTVVLYPSSELPGLFYKGFIEDIILRLRNKGALLLPDFIYFRAHHNKVFMEFLRQDFNNEELKSISSLCFGSVKGLLDVRGEECLKFPLVLKPSAGTGSSGVTKIDDMKHLIKTVRRITSVRLRSFQFTIFNPKELIYKVKRAVNKILRKNQGYPRISDKFILQTFIPNLLGDYKVLVFGQKYYPLFRLNRKSNFTASGSGKFSFPELNVELEKVLNFAKLAYEEINTPVISLDIGFDGNKCHLIEFQCLSFGPAALELSPGWFLNDGKWVFIQGNSILEDEYVMAVDYWLINNA